MPVLYFPAGYYLLKGNLAQLLLINRSLKIIGDGATRSCFLIDPSVPNTADIIKILGKIQQLDISQIGFLVPSGKPGKNYITVDLSNPGDYLKNSSIDKCYFDGQTNGKAFSLLNPVNQDGFFCNAIKDNYILGGMDFERSGDSVSIVRNTISGSGIGINLSTVSGALRTFISENNITSSGGAINLTNADQVSIKNNQIEQTVLGSSGIGNITINGGKNIIIEENNLAAVGWIDTCIHLTNTTKVSIDKNVMATSSSKPTHIISDTGCVDTNVGYKNVYTIDSNIKQNGSFVNNGTGMTNIDIPITLLNGWSDYDATNYGTAISHKTSDGTVHLSGMIKGGTTTAGTQIGTLQSGSTPKKAKYFKCYSFNGSTVVEGSVNILVTGEIYFQSGSNVMFGLDDISFNADSYLP
jgi:hypothetical protein